MARANTWEQDRHTAMDCWVTCYWLSDGCDLPAHVPTSFKHFNSLEESQLCDNIAQAAGGLQGGVGRVLDSESWEKFCHGDWVDNGKGIESLCCNTHVCISSHFFHLPPWSYDKKYYWLIFISHIWENWVTEKLGDLAQTTWLISDRICPNGDR